MDILTGLMIWAAEALTLAVLLWSRWFYTREGFYLSWGGGFAMHGLGVALVAVRGDIPDFISIEVANTVALAGIGLWITGLQQFDRNRVEPFAAIPALLWIAGMFLAPIRESFAYRIALYNGAAMAGYAILVAILVRNRDASYVTRRMLATFIGVQFLCCGVIAALAIINKPGSFAVAPNPAFLFFPAAFCFIAGIMCGSKLLTERSEHKLKELALTDPLTGALNRRGLIDKFHELRLALRHDKPLIAFLHFDLDDFKQINDRCGHQAGDAVLVAFSRIASTSLKERGFFGRMGGEEFAGILRAADLVEAASIAEGIRMTLSRQTIVAGPHEIQVTVSAGIALLPAETADLDRLLSAADRALYAAKEDGRNRTALDNNGTPMIVPAADRAAQDEKRIENRTDRQVSALRRIAAITKN